jgi:hypothetical protein
LAPHAKTCIYFFARFVLIAWRYRRERTALFEPVEPLEFRFSMRGQRARSVRYGERLTARQKDDLYAVSLRSTPTKRTSDGP